MANHHQNLKTTTLTNRLIAPAKKFSCASSKNQIKYSGTAFGNNTKIGIIMMYDGLLYRNPTFAVPYEQFETSMLWLLGRIVDAENVNWDPKLASRNPKSTAYGLFQIINNDWFPTALIRWRRLSINWDKNTPNRTYKVPSQLRIGGKMMTTKKLPKTLKYKSQVFTTKNYIPKYPEFNQKSSITSTSAWDRILTAIIVRNRTKEEIIDYYSWDIISALVVAYIAESDGTDKWLLKLHTDTTDAAKIIYYRGHHLERTYSNNDNDLLAGITVTPGVYSNASNHLVCHTTKATNISPKIGGGVLGPIEPKVPCHGDFDIKDVNNVVDHIFSTLDVKSGIEYLDFYKDRGVIVEEVTDHIPPSTSLIMPGVKEVSGMTRTYRIWNYAYEGKYVAKTTYIVTSDTAGLDEIKKELLAYMRKEIAASSYPKELAHSVRIAFHGKHPAYIFGVIKKLREPVSALNFLIKTEDLKHITRGHGGNRQVTIGPHTLLVFNDRESNYPGVTTLSAYYYPSPTFEANFRKAGGSFKTFTDKTVRILNDYHDVQQSSVSWANAAQLQAEYEPGAKYLKDHIKDGTTKNEGVILGYHDSANDRTVLTLVTPDITQTFLHEIGAHRHYKIGWGAGDDVLFSSTDVINGRIELKLFTDHAYKDARLTYDILNEQILDDYAKGLDGSPAADRLYDEYRKAANVVNNIIALKENPIVKNILPLIDPIYTPAKAEDEFMARMYGTMAMNRCITFQNDVYPLIKDMGITVVTDKIAYEIDRIMREDMKLDMRTYGSSYIRYDPFSIEYEFKGEGVELPKEYHPYLNRSGEEVPYTSIDDGSRIYYALAYLTEFSSDPEEFNIVKGLLGNLLLTASVLGTERDSTLVKVASTLYEVLYQAFQAITIGDVMAELEDIKEQVGGIWTTPPDWLIGRYFKANIITGHVWAGFDTKGTFKIYRKRF